MGAIPVLLFVYTVFLRPRPYFVSEIDIEQDYYYNALLISKGWTVASIHHPGTPIYYLGALLLRIAGSSPDQTQGFFNLCYLLVALSTAGALVAFLRLAAGSLPIRIALLTVASIVSWPPFLTYLNRFGADSFVVALGLPTIALFWRALSDSGARHRRDLFLCGVGVGACLATKMTFVPLAGALSIASSFHSLRFARAMAEGQSWSAADGRRPGRRLIIAMPAGMAISYLFLTAPIFLRLPTVWTNTFRRREAYPPASEAFAAFIKSCGQLLTANPLFVLVVAAAVAALIAIALVAASRGLRAPGRTLPAAEPGQFDTAAAHLFIAIMLSAFLYTIAASAWVTVASENPGLPPDGAEAGIRLRNVSPSALFLPFLLLTCYRAAEGAKSFTRFRRAALPSLCLVIAVLMTGWGFATHIRQRHAFITRRLARIADTREMLSRKSRPDGRTAFWTGASTDSLGDLSFHFWGNYRYARGRFDEDLLRRYPNFTFLRGLREMARGRLADGAPKNSVSAPQRSRYGWIGDLVWRWKRSLQLPEPAAEFFVGERVGLALSLIAIPRKELDVELGPLGESRLLAAVRERTGQTRTWREPIAGTEWLFLSLATEHGPNR